MALTPRQSRFVEEYLIDLNATQAAIRAGYSRKTAEQQGPRLLGNVGVAASIREAQQARSKRTGITADLVLTELAKIGFANMADYMRVAPSGEPILDFSALTRDQAAALQEVRVEAYVKGRGAYAREGKRVKLKLADKRAALVDIGRHLGMFTARHEVTRKEAPLVSEPSKVALMLLDILTKARREPEDHPGAPTSV